MNDQPSGQADTPLTGQSGDIKVCPVDREPVVLTFEFPGAEYHCPTCGWKGGIFAARTVTATPELLARQDVVCETYEKARAERQGVTYRPPPQDVARPTCGACGQVAEGRLDHSGKPPHWYARTRDGVTQYACSRGCITEGAVLPW